VVQNHVGKAGQVHDGRFLPVPLAVQAALVDPAVQAGLPMNRLAWSRPALLPFQDLRAGLMAVPSRAQGPG
jgi:hypothetical protein